MDPYSFSVNTANEFRLRRHIREVLLPYVRTHLTSDHVSFTEKTVEELLLQTLEYVPMADATSFLLPTEPFEVLLHSLHSLDLAPPEERWATSSEHVKYLRTIFPPSHTRDLPTEKYWFEDDHYMRLLLICKPISSPTLSRRARRETPKFGSTQLRASIPRTRSALAAFIDLKPVSVQAIDDLPAPPVDDVLDLRVKLDPATTARVRPFLQLVSVPRTGEKFAYSFEDTPNMPEFLNHDSPPRCSLSLDSPPLFPRITKGRSAHRNIKSDAKSGASNPERISNLTSILQMASPELIDGEDGDINDRHMEVVSGWTTFKFSSPPPPSLHSSNGSGVDELWDISPPGTPATSLMAAKMDEVEIPRIRRFGHKNTLVNEATSDSGAAALLAVANSPGFFITSFISAPVPMPQTQKPITSQPEGVELSTHSPHPFLPGRSTSNSLPERIPSTSGEQLSGEGSSGHVDCVEDLEGQRFNDAVASIYATASQDPLSYIIEEKLDDKEIMLMDVPNLPPPTRHPRDPTLFPEGMQCFIAPKGELSRLEIAGHEVNSVHPTRFLRPVKGIKPLVLDLSWRPFNFGKTIPSDEEVIGIEKPIQPDIGVGYRDEECGKMAGILLDLDTSTVVPEDVQPTLRGCERLGMSPTPKRVEESGCFEYLLTKQERMRASGVNLTLEAEVGIRGNPDSGQDIIPWSYDNGYGDPLTPREDLCHDEEDPFDPVTCYALSRHNCGYSFKLDDSGIDVVDDNFDQFLTSEFGVPSILLHAAKDDSRHEDTPAANKENVDDQCENKENVPPVDVDDCSQIEYQHDFLVTQDDWNGYFKFPGSETPSFEPLSFASQSRLPGLADDFVGPRAPDIPPLTPTAPRVKDCEEHHVPTSEYEQTNSRVIKRRKLDDIVPASSRDLFSTFMALRNQATSGNWSFEHPEIRNDASIPHETRDVPEQILPRGTPDDVFDQHTVRLPEPWIPPAVIHRYLASITAIQKRALVRELQGCHCQVDLVERYNLGGADIIVDPDSGVLFVPILALPVHIEPTIERISRESWRYSSLLLVLEAFPSAQSYRIDHSRDNGPVPYAYTPPICKAIKRLRRNLGIAEGCGTMNPRCKVTWAFANDVEEAAKFVRCFGEEACAISKQRGNGMFWDEREWLEEEEREGESDLARVHGMNAFAAFVMLYDRSLETILDMSPEVRLADFGRLLGEERVTTLNAAITKRIQQITFDTADSVVDTGY